VPNGKNAEPSLAGGQLFDQLGNRLQLVGKVLVGENDTFRIAGGAAGENDGGRLIGGSLAAFFFDVLGDVAVIEKFTPLLDQAAIEQDLNTLGHDDILSHLPAELLVHHNQMLEIRQLIQKIHNFTKLDGIFHKAKSSLGNTENEADFIRHRIAASGDIGCPEGEDCQITGKPFAAVVADQTNEVAPFHSPLGEGGCKTVHLTGELGIGYRSKNTMLILAHLHGIGRVLIYDVGKCLRYGLIHARPPCCILSIIYTLFHFLSICQIQAQFLCISCIIKADASQYKQQGFTGCILMNIDYPKAKQP